jgi:O-antigen/teichoic acid export membrane protein
MKPQRSFLNSLKWAYTANWGERAFSALFVFILASLLGPRDFGLISIALIYISFLQMFLDQGLATALIQRKDLEQEHLDAVFWMDLGLSLVLLLVSIVFGRWWAKLNHAPEAALIISVISVSIVIEALSVVQTALLRRQMDFKSLSIRTNASVLLSGVVGIGMALAGFRVWALVAQQITRDLTALILLWKLSSWRPRLEFSLKHLKDLLGFSIPNFMAQLANFTDVQGSSILLGLLFGPIALGLYRLADRFANCVVVMATSSIQAVSLPEFSRLQDNPAELRKSALSCIRLSSAVTLPALAGLGVVSGPLMATVGAQWAPASNVLKVLCVLSMSLIFAFFTGPLMQALGRTREVAILEWSRTAVGVLLLVLAGLLVRGHSVNVQIMGIALARFANGVFVVAPVFLYILARLCGISFRDLLSSVAPSLLSSASVVGAVTLVRYFMLPANSGSLIVLMLEVGVGAIVGLAVLLHFDKPLREFCATLFCRTLKPPLLPSEAEMPIEGD